MKQFLRNNAPWLTAYAVLLVVAAVALVAVPKAELHLALNAHHDAVLDFLLSRWTLFAVWPVYVLIALTVFYKAGWTAFLAATEALSAAVVHIVKPLLNMPRPLTYFTDTVGDPSLLTLVDGVRMHAWHSFPSGHTATFFAFFIPLILLLTLDWTGSSKGHRPRLVVCQLTLLLLALLGGYSRIYLSQHFLLDVFAGSLISVLSALLLYLLFDRAGWFDKSWFSWRPFLRK